MDEAQNCTPPEELQRQIMSHNEPKNEREWWACHRIEALEAALREKDQIAYIIDGHGITHNTFTLVYRAALWERQDDRQQD